MHWDHFIGHQLQRDWFSAVLYQGRLASTFLFVGPEAIGKRTFALLLAKTLLCQRPSPGLSFCDDCESCVQMEALSHPDLILLSKPADKSFIPVESFVGPRESRMQEGLCHDIHIRPYFGQRKIAIIDDADHLNQEGANCMLKTLEEPPPGAVLILIGTSLQRQLPTIRSRCQVVRFGELSVEDARRLLAGSEIEASDEAIAEALHLCGGDLHQAQTILNEEFQQFRRALSDVIDQPVPSAVDLASLVSGHVGTTGRDASERRERMRSVFRTAVEYYRGKLRLLCDGSHPDAGAIDACLFRIDRCVEALAQVDRNANQQTLIESWAWDIQRGGPVKVPL